MEYKPLSALVFGAGAIGTYIGGSLLLSGQRAVFLEQPAVAEALKLSGLRLNLNGVEQRIENPILASSVPEALQAAPYDIAIFALKSFDTQTALDSLAPYKDRLPAVLCLQNGVENETVLAGVLGDDRVIAGTVTSAIGRRSAGDIVLERKRGLGVYSGHPLSPRLLDGLNRADLNAPVRRLVLNDVGPQIQAAALVRIGTYLGQPVRFDSLEQAADALQLISQGFGYHSREQWLALTEPQIKPNPDGKQGGFVPRYDPSIALPFRAVTPELAAAGEALLWKSYDSLRCPTLLLRGAHSDLLSHATAEAMTRRGPRARLHEFADVGHAPMLVQPEQRAVVREFLLSA